MGAAEDLQRLELAVGRVVSADEHPGARGPSYLLTIDLGPRGEHEATLAIPQYTKEQLVGRQLVCVVDPDELLVLGAQSHADGVVLLRPDHEVENGSTVA